MVDITAHLIKIRDAAALAETATDPAELHAAIEAAISASDALVEFACASADDDLLECAEQAKKLLAELAKGGDEQTRAHESLMEMLLTLASAYELNLDQNADSDASPDGPIVLESKAPDSEALAEAVVDAPDVEQEVTVTNEAQTPEQAPVPPAPAPVAAEPRQAVGGDSEDDERDPEILAEFIIESLEHLVEAEQHLLTLDSDPTNGEGLRALFRGFHTIKGLAGFLNYPSIEALAHAAEDVLAMARDSDQPLPDGASDVILETVDRLQRALHAIRDAPPHAPDAPPDTHADLVERLRSLAGHPAPAMAHVPVRVPAPLAPRTRSRPQVDDDDADADADADQDAPTRPTRSAMDRPAPGRSPRDTLRVDAERLERLVDMVGELVITESMVARALEQAGVSVPGMGRHMTRMAKITRELHELAGSLRMVPVRSTFRKMARLARDVARKSGKTVSFKVLGEEAELDKTLVDRIGDPLVHMVRNAIDHGLELNPEDRLKAGKPEVGQVVLRAVHRGGTVHIEVQDDGRGLDPVKIRARALERGLIRESDVLDNRDIVGLICEPGFSTAEHITSISGRGVGMDVVRQQIESMNGTLHVTSELGKGTCFSMQLPLTLAVIDGMVMRLGGERYVVPTLSVVRLVQPHETQVYSVLARGEVLQLGNELIPIVRPEELFGIQPSADAARLAVVIELDKGKVAMLVDELLGQQQVVIKSLGEGLGDVPGIAGCAIMPDGRVGLVLDVAGIIRTRQATTDLQEAS